ncbi:MAG: hypothetical protein KDK36_07535, partial [Leptospiraceae bacterium]|nr:hypothetical protein [Leptospiraceae bacterium]
MKLIFVIITLLGIFPLLGEDWTPKISIKNGSTGTVGKADTIKLIALDSGMKPVGEYKEKVGEFTLPKINIPDGAPILIQAIYKGVNYNKMVPPAPQFRSKVQEVIVYEKTNSTKDLEVQSLIQIIRLKNFLNIHKVFLLNNKSNFSIDNPSE